MGRSFTKFTYAPDGSVVYKNSGRRMPTTYEVRGSNVYSKGRKVGTVSKAQTKAQREKIAKAHANRLKRSGAMTKVPRKPAKPKQRKPKAPPQKQAGPRSTVFPEPTQEQKEAFAEEVQNALRVYLARFSIKGMQWMKDYIGKMKADVLWEMKENDEYILQKYFEYYEGEPADSKKPEYARWFINVYKSYDAVMSS